MTISPPFWRFLPERPALDAAAVRQAAATGKGALARVLREARAELGAQRAANLLGEVRFDRSASVLVAAPFQPRAIEDALRLAFAIAGIAVELRTIDGFATLAETLRADDEAVFCGVDLALLPLLRGDAVPAIELATALARRCPAPVLVTTFDESVRLPGEDHVEVLPIRFEGTVVDDRFERTFGAIPTFEAADRIADHAAARVARIVGTAPKLLVTDLDGVLWAGTLAEDGASHVGLDDDYATTLRALADDGLLLAVASRNDPRDVERAFAAHPSWPLALRDFTAVEVGWIEKDALVEAVLGRLDLSAEHLVFVDDDPVNCAKVAIRFPDADVRLLTGERAAFSRNVRDDPLLRQAKPTEGDRREQYRRRDAVEKLRSESGDLVDFMRRLRTVLTVEPLRPELFPRGTELAARVNQFALNGWRPSIADLARRASPLDFMVRLEDAFGAHGLVGLVLASAEGPTARMEALFLSCRALGRGVETAVLQVLGQLAVEAGCEQLSGKVEKLPRNEPARICFSQYLDKADGSSWTIRLNDEPTSPAGITLRWARRTT